MSKQSKQSTSHDVIFTWGSDPQDQKLPLIQISGDGLAARHVESGTIVRGTDQEDTLRLMRGVLKPGLYRLEWW